MRYRLYILQLIILCSLLLPHSAGAIDYTYDLNGNRITMTDPTGTTYYEYDALNRLISITNPNGEITSYTYDTIGRRTGATLPNGVVTSYNYDAASRLTSLTHELNGAIIASFSYTHDKVGNRVTMTDEYGTHTYTYDTKYQLIQAIHPNQPTETYSYDAVGNRWPTTNVYNAANQLLEDDDYIYSYDKNGNTIKKVSKADNSGTIFIWYTDGNLGMIRKYNNINDAAPASTAKYTYDGLGRRVAKSIDGAITKYVYDEEDILLETDENDNIIARYTHGPWIDEPISMDRGGQSYFYLTDGLGSVVKLVDNVGNIVNSYAYNSFGDMVEKIESVVNPYTYTAREHDSESNLYYYRFRYYDSSSGRFLSEDPVNFSTAQLPIQIRPKGCSRVDELMNNPLQQYLYLYTQNNPINFNDPWGQIISIIPPIEPGKEEEPFPTPSWRGKICANLVTKGDYGTCSSCCSKQFSQKSKSTYHEQCTFICKINIEAEDTTCPLN